MALPKNKRPALEDLFRSMFDDHELRVFVRRLPEADEIVAGLPGEVAALSKVVSEVIGALHRRGRVDLALFETLVEERPQRRGDIAEVASLWGLALPGTAANPWSSPPWRTLAEQPSFLRPGDRASQAGLRLIAVSTDGPTPHAHYPTFQFTLKNETPGHLTLLGVTVEVESRTPISFLSGACLLEPADHWDVELPLKGGTSSYRSHAPIEILPDRSVVIIVRFHVKDGDARLPPGHRGSYELRVTFETGEGASAVSERLPCGARR